jgi:hypothetical protein
MEIESPEAIRTLQKTLAGLFHPESGKSRRSRDTASAVSRVGRPFDLADAAAYAAWRERKLDTAPRRIEDILVPLERSAPP